MTVFKKLILGFSLIFFHNQIVVTPNGSHLHTYMCSGKVKGEGRQDPKNDTGHPVATPPKAHTMGHYF